jgi:hypothetical protein
MAVSPTPEPTATGSPDIKEKIEERIQKVLTTNLQQKRAFAGEITDINTVIELKTREGDKQTMIDNASFFGSNGGKIKLEDLEIGNYIIAMGYLNENGVLDGRRIVVSSKPKDFSRQVIFGKVTDLSSDGERVLTVKNPKNENVYEIAVNNQTVITQILQDQSENVDFDQIKKDNYIIVIENSKTLGQGINASSIQIIPDWTSWITATNESTTGESTQSATSSSGKPTPTPTKAAKISPTPTAEE